MDTNELLKNEEKKTNNYISRLGPGIISGAADDDPSGIATYSQTGAQFGTSLIWLAAWTFPLMAMVQEMCARIAIVTGKGLASNIKHAYSKNILYICTILLFFANTLNIGADLGAIAKAIQLLYPNMSFILLVIVVGLFGLTLEIFIPYKNYAKYLKWLVITLFSYVLTGLIIQMDWSTLLVDGIIPHITFNKTQILIITGIIGTTMSPYLFFWQTSQEVEEQIAEGKTTVHMRQYARDNKKDIKRMRFDVWFGMLLSNVVMFFIIAVCANTLFSNGINNISTASDAALALKPFAGNWAFLLFAIGIIGTGMLAIPVLAGSTSYAISESFGWKEGLYRKLKEAKAFYGIMMLSIIVGIIINIIGIDPIKALIYSAIVNGIIAPIIVLFVVHISSSKKVMGHYKNSKIINVLGYMITILMSIASIASIYYLFR